MDITVEPVSLRLREPVRAAWGTVSERSVLLVRLRDPESGLVGVGEAGPLAGYDDVSLDEVRAELEAGAPRSPFARAALDVAQWDLRGRREGRAVAQMLAEDPLDAVPVSSLVGMGATVDVPPGTRCVKVKVGDDGDIERVAAVRRAVGEDVALRLDANGAWSVDEAVTMLGSLARFGIELCEEPVHGVEELRSVRDAVEVPIAMDETARVPGAVGSGAADAVCLRIGWCGGISGMLDAAAQARAAGSDVYLASSYDGPVGVAAAVHAAVALRVSRPCGLGTLGLFEGVDEGALAVADGAIRVPDGPGLGVGPG